MILFVVCDGWKSVSIIKILILIFIINVILVELSYFY